MTLLQRNHKNFNEFDLLLEKLISNEIKDSDKFRYFTKRSIDVVNNHLITILIKEDLDVAAYGHIDLDSSIHWLGVYTAKDYRGLGFGKIVMTELLHRSAALGVKSIRLSVDKDNQRAIKLYKSYGFQIHSDLPHCYIYELEL